jgi:hypothetical protein
MNKVVKIGTNQGTLFWRTREGGGDIEFREE